MQTLLRGSCPALLCPERANEGLDERSMEVLNGDFEDTWKRFADTIRQLRQGQMNGEALEREMEEYWLSPYLDPAHPGGKAAAEPRLTAFGNEDVGGASMMLLGAAGDAGHAVPSRSLCRCFLCGLPEKWTGAVRN